MSDVLIDRPELESLGQYEFGWHDSDEAGAVAKRGLSEAVVRNISALKSETDWMLERRLKGLQLFERKPMPTWGADISGIDTNDETEISYKALVDRLSNTRLASYLARMRESVC